LRASGVPVRVVTAASWALGSLPEAKATLKREGLDLATLLVRPGLDQSALPKGS